MSKEDWVANPIHKILEAEGLWPFKDGEIISVLDVACGLSLKSKFLKCPITVGVDIHEPYLNAIEADIPYIPIKGDITNLLDMFMPKSFDVVYALDVLEHLEKDDALELISNCKKVAGWAVVIETPEGFVPQNMDIQGFDAHHLQTHRCGWEVEELEELGFACVVREYTMQDVQRHTELEVDPHVNVINGICVV